MCLFVCVFLSFHTKIRSELAHCAHNRCCLSEVTKNTETHKYLYTGPNGQAGISRDAHVTVLTCKLQTIWSVQINFTLLSAVFPTQFTSPSQLSLCLSLILSPVVSFCLWSLPLPDPPLPPFSRWDK